MKLLIGCMLQKGSEPYNIVLQQILLGGTYLARVTVSSKIHCDGDGSFDGWEPKMVGGILSYLVGYFIMISDRISDTYCIQNYNEISKNQEWGSSEISDALYTASEIWRAVWWARSRPLAKYRLIIASGTQATYVLSLNQKIKGQRVGSGWQGTA